MRHADARRRDVRLSAQACRCRHRVWQRSLLAFVRDRGAMPHIPVLERSAQTGGMFTRAAFRFDRNHDCYICPTGKVLSYKVYDQRTGVRRYRARSADCGKCSLRSQCTTSRFRAVPRMDDEDARDLVRAETRTGLFKRSMRLRRGVERLFADAKARRGLARLHLRGLRGAEEEFLAGAAVLNLLLLARPPKRPVRPRRSPPPPARVSPMAAISRRGFLPAEPGVSHNS